MSKSLRSQVRATYHFARSKGLLACEAFALALASVRLPARRAHYVQMFRHIAE